MSNNDVAEIQATLKNIGVSVTPEQIENKLKTLARFNVTGAEAKRNATRSLARSAGVDPSALYKGSSTLASYLTGDRQKDVHLGDSGEYR
jgi:hypothetical protein